MPSTITPPNFVMCVCVLCINCDSIKLITIPPSSLLPQTSEFKNSQTHTIWWCFPYIWASSSEKLRWKALFTTFFFFRNLFRENHEWKTETVGDLCSCSAARSMSRARLWTPTTLRTLQTNTRALFKTATHIRQRGPSEFQAVREYYKLRVKSLTGENCCLAFSGLVVASRCGLPLTSHSLVKKGMLAITLKRLGSNHQIFYHFGRWNFCKQTRFLKTTCLCNGFF